MALAVPKRMQGQTASHARSRAQEQSTAKRIGGSVTKASGASYEKGDVRLKGFVRIESKTTKSRSFSITQEILAKLERAVVGSGEIPILQVELELGKCKVLVMPDWALEFIIDAMGSKP